MNLRIFSKLPFKRIWVFTMSEQSFNQPQGNGIFLKDIIDFLSEFWKAIALSGIVGGLLATGYAFIAPTKYQAKASIQVAKVAGADVETPSTLLEKLKMPMYYSKETHVACNVVDMIEPGEVIANNLKPTLSKTAPIINFSYIEKTSKEAQKCLEGVLNDIRNNHNSLANPILESKKNQLTNLKKKLEATEGFIRDSSNKNSNFDFSDSKFSASILLLVNTLSKENELRDLLSQIAELEISLSEPQTMEVILITQIYAPKQKISPKLPLIVIGGVMAGLFLGLLLIIGKRTCSAYNMSNQQVKN